MPLRTLLFLRRSGQLLAWLILGAGAAGAVSAQEVSGYRSSQAGDRLTPIAVTRFADASGQADFVLDERLTDQTMLGFGASFLEAGMICLNTLEPAAQERVLEALFDVEKGAGFSAMKTVIGGTDFMSAGGFYTYDDVPGDVELKHFSIARDLGPNGLVTYIKRARRYGRFLLQAPMDYPPDWMLVDVHGDQNVDRRYYDVLARYYLRYLQEYEKQDIFIDCLSPFNEPSCYTNIPFPDLRDLLKDHVGPLFRREGVKTTLWLCDNYDRVSAARDLPVVLDDPAAFPFVAGLAYHGYDWQYSNWQQPRRPTPEAGYTFKEFDAIRALHRRYPTLPLWMTEICYWNSGTPWAKPLPRYEFEDGDWWGQQIFSDIEAGASGWTYWNMILDQDGGPWLTDKLHHNPADNAQHPVVVINRQTKRVSFTGLYYYLAHFSKFVRPGAVRISASGRAAGVRCLAFRRPDGRIVTQLMNSAPDQRPVKLTWRQQDLAVVLPARSITTYLWSALPRSETTRN